MSEDLPQLPLPSHGHQLERLGWTPDDDSSFALAHEGARIARVIIVHGGYAEVMFLADGDMASETVTFSSALDATPVAGDWAAVRDGKILGLASRRTAVERPDPDGNRTQVLAANIDVVLIVVAAVPRPSLRAVERMQVMAWDSGAKPVLVVTKADQCLDPEELLDYVAPVSAGIEVVVSSSADGRGLDHLRGLIQHGTTTMLGASGAGKTSLLNALDGADAAVAAVRRDGQGRHTTTTRRLFFMRPRGVMLDIPGIRSLSLHATQDGIADTFEDIAGVARYCRFGDCTHDGIAGCAVAAAITDGEIPARRLESWLAVQRELSFQERRNNPAAMAEQRKQWKQATKMSRKRR